MRNETELEKEFFVLTRDGMKHVGKLFKANDRPNQTNKHGGLYCYRTNNDRHFAPKFASKLKRQSDARTRKHWKRNVAVQYNKHVTEKKRTQRRSIGNAKRSMTVSDFDLKTISEFGS